MSGDDALHDGKGAAPSGRPRVVVLVVDHAARSRVRDALRDRWEVTFVARCDELAALVSHRGVDVTAAIVEARDADGSFTAPSVAFIREICPAIAVIAYVQAGADTAGEIRELVLAGTHELLFRGVDDVGIGLRAALDAGRRVSVGERVLAALRPLLPFRARPLAEYALRHLDAGAGVAEAAYALGLNRKTLANHCREAGIASPGVLIAACRLAVVAHLLVSTRRTVESIALELNYPSDTALRNMLKRYTGLRAAEIRARGDFAAVIHLLAARMGIAVTDSATAPAPADSPGRRAPAAAAREATATAPD